MSCVVSTDVSDDDYADLYEYICSEIDCSGISANGTTGKYGDLSACDAEVKLSFLLDIYYNSIGESYACDFSGSAVLKDASTQKGCSAVVSQLGSIGTNVISATATYTGDFSYGTATGTADADSSASSTTVSSKAKSSGTASNTASSSSSSASSSKSKNMAPAAAPSSSKVLISLLATIGVFAGMSFAMI